jgi:hypothetical protein
MVEFLKVLLFIGYGILSPDFSGMAAGSIRDNF